MRARIPNVPTMCKRYKNINDCIKNKDFLYQNSDLALKNIDIV